MLQLHAFIMAIPVRASGMGMHGRAATGASCSACKLAAMVDAAVLLVLMVLVTCQHAWLCAGITAPHAAAVLLCEPS
jgi:hypothetical protein